MKENSAKQQTFSKQDLELLGFSDAKATNHPQWDLFSAVAPAGLETIQVSFVYLKADYRNLDAEKAKATLPPNSKAYVVIPKSSSDRLSGLQAIFGPAVKIFVHEDLIWEKIGQTFGDYLSSLRSNILQEPYYVAPRRVDGGPHARLDDELLKLLNDKAVAADGLITVVRAPAGIGKTTLARQLTKTLADRALATRVIPIYVEATHWGRLQLASLGDLWEMIDNSLRIYGPSLRLSNALFEHLLRQGYLAFVFDGFDELCGHRHAAFTPREVLDELLALARESLAKIVLTTRTLYWEAAVGGNCDGLRILDLAPFNKQQAYGYFDNVFKRSPAKKSQAQGLYSQLVKSNEPPTPGGSRAQFFNHPFCVQMISQCVERGFSDDFEFESNKSFLQQFLRQICQRETRRQSLLTPADSQLAAFEQLAVSEMNSPSAVFELDMCSAAGFDTRDIPKLMDHPLLSAHETPEGKRNYAFRYDFLASFFRARFLVSTIRNFSSLRINRDAIAWDLMSQEASGKGDIVEHILSLLDRDDLPMVAGCLRAATTMVVKGERASSFLFHIARLLIETSNMSRRERSEALFGLIFGETYRVDRTIHELCVIGHLDKLDLSGTTFIDSVFCDSIFTDCIADSQTCFKKCVFTGSFQVIGTDRKTWRDISLMNCQLDFPTNLAWEEVLPRGYGAKEQNIRDALKLALTKFWKNGQPHFSINKNYWAKGPLGHSIHCKSILDAMLKCKVLSEITISGLQDGGYAYSKEALADLQRFMDNGQLTGKIRDVFRVLFG